jgi:hypothetical protein
VLHLDLHVVSTADAVSLALEWLTSNPIATLNVAGPRASEDARIYDATLALLSALLAVRP